MNKRKLLGGGLVALAAYSLLILGMLAPGSILITAPISFAIMGVGAYLAFSAEKKSETKINPENSSTQKINQQFASAPRSRSAPKLANSHQVSVQKQPISAPPSNFFISLKNFTQWGKKPEVKSDIPEKPADRRFFRW